MACVGDTVQVEYDGSKDDISNMGTTARVGQSFKVPSNCNVCAVSFYGGKGTVGTQPGTFRIEILTGSMTGTVIADSGVLSTSGYGVWTSPQWWKVPFISNVDLVAGTTYYMRMTAVSGSTNDCMRLALDTTPSYTDGQFWIETTGYPSLDANFRVHGTVGGSSYSQTCTATARGAATVTTKKSLKQIILATVSGASTVLRARLSFMTMNAAIRASASTSSRNVLAIVINAMIGGTAILSNRKTFKRTLVAAVDGSATVATKAIAIIVLTATVKGTAVVNKGKMLFRTLTANVGAATSTSRGDIFRNIILTATIGVKARLGEYFYKRKYQEEEEEDYKRKFIP